MFMVLYADYNDDERVRIMIENGEVVAKKLVDEAEFDDGYGFDNMIGNGIAVKNLGSEFLKHVNEFAKHDNVFTKDDIEFKKDDVKFELHDVKIVVDEKYVSRVEYDVDDVHFKYKISDINETKFEIPTEYKLIEE